VHADFARKLGAMDPFEREMFIGLGCALENMAIAGPGVGLITEIVLLPESTRELAARVLLKRAEVSPHRLEMAIPKRRTHRGAYEISQQISPDTIRLLQDEVGAEHFRLVFLAAESAEAAGFIELTVEATQDIIGDRAMAHDSARWYRQNQTQIARARDGLTMQTQGLPSWLATTAILMPQAPEYVTHRMWLKNTRDVQLPTAARFGMIVVPQAHFFDDATSLRVGRAWQRLHLAATLLGLACQPMNQIPERISREHQLGCEPRMRRAAEERFQLDRELPTFCFRIGRSLREPPHSPRRAAEMVMN
jgi:hypothetical protein